MDDRAEAEVKNAVIKYHLFLFDVFFIFGTVQGMFNT